MTALATGLGPIDNALDAKVLVLNRLYAVIRVVDARRAFALLAKQAAEVIALENGTYRNYDFETWADLGSLQQEFEADDHDWVRTTRVVIAVPKIIRVLGYDRLPREVVKLNRRNIYARDGSRCQYCGKPFPTRELTLDHVVPRVQGGENSWTNLVCACVRCNARKGGRTPAQASMKLIRAPKRPRRNPAIALRLGSPRYQSWKAFLDEAYWTVELT
ncbi:MAG: HNH endonuclease [Phycisphaerales bacterium]|jgi:5-methylcytosine-specific restriction endonuclease McrA|nr:HNH endonuclease [Planctomycetota bacterium]